MNRISIVFIFLIIMDTAPVFAASPTQSLESLKRQITARYTGVTPVKWGENVQVSALDWTVMRRLSP